MERKIPDIVYEMTFLRNSVVHMCSWAIFCGSLVWLFRDPGFEPALGLIASVGGLAASKDEFPLQLRRQRYLSPERKIELRDRWRPVFDDFFRRAARDRYRTDVIVHDVARLDEYPDILDHGSISSWFRVGLMGTYQRGVLLGLRWTYVSQDEHGNWVEHVSNQPKEAVKVMLLGEVPYELIESFNPDGDTVYNKPHIYCHFDFGGEPYERLFYGQENKLFDDAPRFFTEIAVFVPPPLLRRLAKNLRLF